MQSGWNGNECDCDCESALHQLFLDAMHACDWCDAKWQGDEMGEAAHLWLIGPHDVGLTGLQLLLGRSGHLHAMHVLAPLPPALPRRVMGTRMLLRLQRRGHLLWHLLLGHACARRRQISPAQSMPAKHASPHTPCTLVPAASHGTSGGLDRQEPDTKQDLGRSSMRCAICWTSSQCFQDCAHVAVHAPVGPCPVN